METPSGKPWDLSMCRGDGDAGIISPVPDSRSLLFGAGCPPLRSTSSGRRFYACSTFTQVLVYGAGVLFMTLGRGRPE